MKSPLDVFAQGARDGAYPGGQLAASREGQRLVNAAVGKLEPAGPVTTPDVRYDLASLTKPLATAVLSGRALEQDRCRLSDPVGRYVPGVEESVTIEGVLEHSTGFDAHRRFDRTLPPSITPGGWRAWRHIVSEAARAPRSRPAGEKAEYSDIGFILLGAALEAIHGAPLSTAQAALVTPLFFRDRRGAPAVAPTPSPAPFAPTEDGLAGEVHDENARAMGGAAGHAGLFGTAEGVLSVAEDLVAAYHGRTGGLLRPETVRRLWRPSTVPGSTRTLGWDRPSPSGSSTGGAWPPHSVGHLGFTGTSLWIEPERALIVVLITNRVCPTCANDRIRRVRPALYGAAWEAWGRPKPGSPASVFIRDPGPPG